MPKTYVAADIDFKAIEAHLATLQPSTLTLDEVVERIRPQLKAARKRGVTWRQLVEALHADGIRVGVRRLQAIVEKG